MEHPVNVNPITQSGETLPIFLMHTSPTHPIETDFLSDEDVQSFFSCDWGEEGRSGKSLISECPSVADSSADVSSGNPVSIAQQVTLPALVVHEVSTGIPVTTSRSVQLTHVAGSFANLLSEMCVQPMEESRASIPSFDTQSGIHISLEELKRIYPNPSGNLKTDVVIKAFSKKYTTLDASNVGRLAVLLARYCFFGDRVLHASTLKGKSKRPPLDFKTYECLISCIHNTYPYSDMTKTEFRNKIQPKIQRALVDFLKRNKKL